MVVACGSNSARDLVSFFRIPSEYDNHKQFNKLASERRKAWINRLKRADLTESKIKNGRICSKHFISGKIPCSWQPRLLRVLRLVACRIRPSFRWPHSFGVLACAIAFATVMGFVSNLCLVPLCNGWREKIVLARAALVGSGR
ncbi:hypothetical protein NQ317_014844 [Molorchus minor]|uniref:THAP-type domain-containing protein n=1 Tax=Molorchus minor TaxID=1323400 RepID=A0ABQ9JVA3_9CUCU|nr:hypothetical protein NQ317_014844 [Molorchus minor]